jgi:type III restriction enzyme
MDLTSRREKREFSRLTLVSEVARYLNTNPLEIESLPDSTKEDTDLLVTSVNQFNELLYDVIIPELFAALYTIDESQVLETIEIDLIKPPPNGYYEVTADDDKTIRVCSCTVNLIFLSNISIRTRIPSVPTIPTS